MLRGRVFRARQLRRGASRSGGARGLPRPGGGDVEHRRIDRRISRRRRGAAGTSTWPSARANAWRSWAATAWARPPCLRAVMGHLRPAAGRIVFAGRAITGLEPFAIANSGIAYVPQGREIFADFSVEENLLLGLIGKERAPAAVPETIYARFPILAERRRQRAGTMSGGEQQQLALARAIISQPPPAIAGRAFRGHPAVAGPGPGAHRRRDRPPRPDGYPAGGAESRPGASPDYALPVHGKRQDRRGSADEDSE